MIIVLFLISLFGVYLILKSSKFDPLSKRVLYPFLLLWGISLFISIFNPYGLYSVSFFTYILLFISVFSFLFGFISIPKIKVATANKISYLNIVIDKQLDGIIYNKIYIIIILISIVICIAIFQQYKYLLLDEQDIDRSQAVLEACKNTNLGLFYSFLLEPLFLISNFICSYCIIFHKKLWVIIIHVVYIISYSLLGGGRISYLVLFLALYFVFFLKQKTIRKKKIKKKSFVFLSFSIISVYIFLCYLSTNRTVGIVSFNWESFSWDNILYGSNILNEHFITYLTLPFRLLDHAFKTNYVDQIGGYQFGLCTFDGIDRYIYLILNKLGVDYQMNAIKTIYFFQDARVNVASDIVANYAYTYLLFFFVDFGVLGILFIPYLFGAFISKMIKLFFKRPNIAQLIFVFYLFYLSIYSIFTWELQKEYSLLFILFLFVWSKKLKRVNTV